LPKDPIAGLQLFPGGGLCELGVYL
jgi:hypothetical protein